MRKNFLRINKRLSREFGGQPSHFFPQSDTDFTRGEQVNSDLADAQSAAPGTLAALVMNNDTGIRLAAREGLPEPSGNMAIRL